MRIIAGEFKNRTIAPPRSKSLDAITEMVREALFNILGDIIVGARFADLYAGSGVVGVEALSRGARRVTFVDCERSNVKVIERNLSVLGIERDRARVWHNDVLKLGESQSEWSEWDIVFLDPPIKVQRNFLDLLVNHETIQSDTLVIVKRPADRRLEVNSPILTHLDQRIYRDTSLYFYSVR